MDEFTRWEVSRTDFFSSEEYDLCEKKKKEDEKVKLIFMLSLFGSLFP